MTSPQRKLNFFIQASSKSWSGGRDLCMNEIEGNPIIFWTIKKIIDNFEDSRVALICPAFDEDGGLGKLKSQFSKSNFSINYSYDESPLARMVDASREMSDQDFFIRLDGLHLCIDPDSIRKAIDFFCNNALDFLKFPDDFPAQLAFEIYGVRCIRQTYEKLKKTGRDFEKFHPT